MTNRCLFFLKKISRLGFLQLLVLCTCLVLLYIHQDVISAIRLKKPSHLQPTVSRLHVEKAPEHQDDIDKCKKFSFGGISFLVKNHTKLHEKWVSEMNTSYLSKSVLGNMKESSDFPKNMSTSLLDFQDRNLQNATAMYHNRLYELLRSVEFINDDNYTQSDMLSFFKLRAHTVNSFVPEVLIQAFPPCHLEGPFLLVAVPSTAGSTATRDAIRETWGSLARGAAWPRRSNRSYDVKVVFFLGVQSTVNMTSLREESKRHKDIVMGDFQDSYRNLTVKMAFALHWTVEYCEHAKHFLKADEDTFVNIPLLMDVLSIISCQHERYVIGCKHPYPKPPVLRHGRWEVSKTAYPFPFFPRYVYGATYAISQKAVKDLFTAYQHMALVLVEDAYFTGILAKTMNILRIHSSHFAMVNNNQCLLLEENSVSLMNFRDASDLRKMWSQIGTGECE